jgi:hypothetical protein
MLVVGGVSRDESLCEVCVRVFDASVYSPRTALMARRLKQRACRLGRHSSPGLPNIGLAKTGRIIHQVQRKAMCAVKFDVFATISRQHTIMVRVLSFQ